MSQVNMLEAKTHLSRLVEAVESGAEKEIIIARNGKPAARLVPVEEKPKKVRLGLARGKYPPISLEEFNALDEEIAKLFNEGPLFPEER
jgi:prevent-host-death family protein